MKEAQIIRGGLGRDPPGGDGPEGRTLADLA
jgi:hypothetical protein